MKNRIFSTTLAALASLTLHGQTKEKPNLILFMADDCSYYDIGPIPSGFVLIFYPPSQ